MTDLHVTTWGEGPRAVLVHGSMSFGELAFSEQRPLAERWRLELLDRRGYGRSPERDGRVDFAEDARDLAAALDEPAHVLGHSYGGLVCLLAAALRPEQVRSLTVIEPPAFALARGDAAVEKVIADIDRHFETGQGLTEDPFAMSRAVDVRGVEEVDAGVERVVDRADRLVVVDLAPTPR